MSQDQNSSEQSKVFIIPVTIIEDEVENESRESASAPLAAALEPTAEPTAETAPRRPRNSFKILFSKFGTLATIVVVLVALVLVGTKLAGFRAFTVMSGSMEPEFPVGSMIYIRPIDYQSLNIGDVVSYVANSDKTVVTHRIVDIEIDPSDSNVWRFKTQGDANAAPDATLVHYKNILGTPVVVVPLLGYLAYYIQQPPGIYITLVVGTLLLAWTFLPNTLEERRKTASKRMT
ncbi:signal peptidase I [Candidatus Saccharibacteria bacterium]|nr:signal peptidase I [Candidatus Saccharibacteria bacterium]